MRGADALVQASAHAGIDLCFANPGTTEMAMVDALRQSTAIRPVLVLFEGVGSGAADGYARIAGRPAALLLHLGPGLANAAANLHNARRGQSPVVCWIGDHTSSLLPHDPPLASDIVTLAQPFSRWVKTVSALERLPFDAADAVTAALGPPPGVAALIVRAELQEAKLTETYVMPAPLAAKPVPAPLDAALLQRAARRLREATNPLVLLGGVATEQRGLRDAARIAEASEGRLLLEQFPRCLRRAPGLPAPDKLAYLPFMARRQIALHDLIVVAGADRPVCFFGYEGEAPRLEAPGTEVIDLAAGGCDVLAALEAVAAALDADPRPRLVAAPAERAEIGGVLQPETLCRTLAKVLPQYAIVVDEGITSSLALYPALTGAAPHDYIANKGGSIGFGIPAATGAALAAPSRRVVCYVGDGSAAYTIQALWTQAREELDVTTIVLVNKSYAVLQMELMRTNSPIEGASRTMTEIGGPDLDFVRIAKGFGVPAREVRDLVQLEGALRESFATPGPMLIAAMLR
jgi:acetolactate synthase-1/2/3 large subunit